MVADHDHVLGARCDKPSAATPRPRPPQHARSYLVGGKLPRGWQATSWVARAAVQQRHHSELRGGLHDLTSSDLTNEVSLKPFVTIVRVW